MAGRPNSSPRTCLGSLIIGKSNWPKSPFFKLLVKSAVDCAAGSASARASRPPSKPPFSLNSAIASLNPGNSSRAFSGLLTSSSPFLSNKLKPPSSKLTLPMGITKFSGASVGMALIRLTRPSISSIMPKSTLTNCLASLTKVISLSNSSIIGIGSVRTSRIGSRGLVTSWTFSTIGFRKSEINEPISRPISLNVNSVNLPRLSSFLRLSVLNSHSKSNLETMRGKTPSSKSKPNSSELTVASKSRLTSAFPLSFVFAPRLPISENASFLPSSSPEAFFSYKSTSKAASSLVGSLSRSSAFSFRKARPPVSSESGIDASRLALSSGLLASSFRRK